MNIFRIQFISLSIAVFSFSILSARLCNFDLDVFFGYRNDNLTTSLEASEDPPEFLFSQKLEQEGLQIPILGIKGKVVYNNKCFIKLYGDYGYIASGETEHRFIDGAGLESELCESVSSGHVYDFSLAIGYLFYPCTIPNLSMAPEFGWSTAGQNVRAKHDVNYKNEWMGPWIGLEAVYNFFCIKFIGGYEYHLASWHGGWSDFNEIYESRNEKDSLRSSNATGNIVYLEAVLYQTCRFDFGIEGMYQYWKAKESHHDHFSRGSYSLCHFLNPSTDIDDIEIDLEHAVWRSWSFFAYVKYRF